MENVILSFHDCVIKQSDMNLLDGPEWLNDRLISFFFQYLEKVKYGTYEKGVCFIDPEVCQCIKLSRGSCVGVFADPHDLQKKDLILLTVNDCEDEEAAGGTHWSLLVFVRHFNSFYHFDSFGGANLEHGRDVMNHLIPFVKCESMPSLVEATCLQQQNSFDCGIHVICNAEYICAKYLEHFQGDVMDYVTLQSISGKRKWLKKCPDAIGSDSANDR
uniref:Ubiquitin-like protease family profile domain-containing protein n=1 Tax=Strigamia maritima TaxID=126957 RepID=T1IXK3_STRMM